jgi:molybdate transport system substrate-binding protein
MKNVVRWIAIAAIFGASAAVAQAATVTVFAAASLKEAMGEQARLFEAKASPAGSDKIVVSYAGSNTLAKQIEAGAPADVFVSADLDWMDYLYKRHLLMAGTRGDLLRNTLVLVAPAASKSNLKIAPGFGLAAALGSDKLALANPDSVPAGKYAKSALEMLGVWTSVEKQVARAENVRAALALVSRTEAPFGVVYSTDAFSDKGVRIVDTFPANSHPPIVYPAALIATSQSPAARPFLEYLHSAAATTVWKKYGFEIAQ